MGIIGENLEPGLIKQIKVRQEKLGKTQLDTDDIMYTNSNSSWLRVASSVNVNDVNLAGLDDFAAEGGANRFAKNAVLFGPVVNSQGELPYGALPTNSTRLDNTAQSSYGFGGFSERWGYSPPPGVQDLSIQDLNRGAIRKASISLVAHNPDQFRLIEALYLRLGFTILVEWGHVMYFDNNKTLQQRNAFSTKPFDQFMNGKAKFTEIINNIQQERENTDYNYDGFIGYISNFNWNFNPDGTYSIQLDVITRGGLIDSLKTNHTDGKEPDPTIENPKGDVISNLIQKWKETLKAQDITISAGGKIEGSLASIYDEEEYQYRDEEGNLVTGTAGDAQSGYQFSFERDYELLRIDYQSADDPGKPYKETPQYYMTLGTLLRLLKERCLFYDDNQDPIVDIDHEYEKSFFLTHPYQNSTDPTVCFLRSSSPYFTSLYRKEVVTGIFPCYDRNNFDTPIESEAVAVTDTNPFKGDMMAIPVNMDFILATIESTKDDDGKVSLGPLVNNILTGIANVTGNINKFRGTYDENKNQFVVFDDNSIPGVTPKRTETGKLHVYGFNSDRGQIKQGSFVKQLSFSSKIFPSLQNSVAIAAQNPDVTAGEQISSFQRLNKGLTDRVAQGAKPYSAPKATNPYNYYINELSKVSSHFEVLYNYYFLPTKEVMAEMDTPLNEILNYDLQWRAGAGEISSPFFIPVELSVTLNGLAGFKQYEKFDITPDYILPPSYPNNVNFIIQGVSHDIKDNEWTTTLNTLSWTAAEVAETSPTFETTGVLSGSPTSAPFGSKAGQPSGGANISGPTDPSLAAELWWGDCYSLNRSFGVTPFTPTDPETVVKYVNPKVAPYMKDFLQRALKHPKMQGLRISVNSAVRTFEDQKKQANNDVSARPGTSPHNYGCALDMTLYDLATNAKVRDNNNTAEEWAELGIIDALNEAKCSSWGATFKKFDPLHFGMKFDSADASVKAQDKAIANGKSFTELTAQEILELDINIYPGTYS